MSGAQSWSVKGIDPKIREAAREAAQRSGMSLGEYLSAALQKHQPPTLSQPQPQREPPPRMRGARFGSPTYEADDEEDWHVSGPTTLPRVTDPVRLAQRIDSIERRTQLAVSGLDRAVSTIDRSVLGLAARIEDAESVSGESADRIAEALEHFRVAGDTLGGRLEQAEHEVSESRRALEEAYAELSETKSKVNEQLAGAQSEFTTVKEVLAGQVAIAEEVARRAEAAASFLTTELENRDATFSHRLGSLEQRTHETLTNTLSEARAAAEEAARQATEASTDAVTELRRLQERMSERLTETEHSARRAIETAIEQTRHEQADIAERAARAETEARNVRDSLLEEVVRLEGEIGARIAAADQLKTEQAILISRIERAEAGARESTAGLRQAAGAAIADLRNAQLGLAARVKQVEETAGRSGVLDLAEVRAQQTEIAERLAALETKTDAGPVNDALAAFEKRLADINARVDRGDGSSEKLEEVGGAVKTMDQALQRLAERIAETESTANNAIRTLEETVSTLGAKVETSGAAQETEALRHMLEQRLDTMAQSVTQMVGEARVEIAGQVTAALDGLQDEGLEGALADVNRRLAAAERRQAQTIEAISIEIKRMSETVDKRLRLVETRNDDAAASAVREELARMAHTLETRFDEIERREAAGFDRMGLEVGRLSERLEERVGAVEGRSAQAIEHVGEQVARMAERFNARHETLARELGERMIDSEERAGARVSEAISSIMHRLSEVEEHSAEAIAPVQKAVSGVASRLEAFESAKEEDIPNPSRRFGDFEGFDTPAPEAYVSPRDAAQPLRAGPLPPTTPPAAPVLSEAHNDLDIYFAEEADLPSRTTGTSATQPVVETKSFDLPVEDELIIEDPFLDEIDAFAPPPPEDDDPFWTPDVLSTVVTGAPTAPTHQPAAASAQDEMTLTVAPAPTAPPSKNDYLNAARKAAQAQTAAKPERKGKKSKHAEHDVAPTPQLSLRGSSRIVVWGAASAIALLIAGGAWYLNAREGVAPTADPQQPEPDVTTPTAAIETSVQPYDPNAPFGEPVQDPFAEQTGEVGATPADGGVPVAQNQGATRQAVVAGPLAPRAVSLEQAAQGGDVVAQYELALQRIAAGRGEDGVPMLRRAADRGLAMAQYRLAKLYERGEGVPTDLVQARQWTERAAAAGNRRAMHDLGVYFARGEGAPLDEAAAFRWFRQAAELGVADSQYNLGVLYQQGRGVGASPSEALFWFMVAARQGDEDAAGRAQTLQAQLQPMQLEQARARAQAFRPRAASAQANGEFGARPWSAAAARPAA